MGWGIGANCFFYLVKQNICKKIRHLDKVKKCRPQYGHSRGTVQHQCSCQNSCSIHVYVVPTAVCTHVLYTLIVTVQLSFLSD